MEPLATKIRLKVVGSKGQISIGKKFAGRQVLVEKQAPGVWLIRTALAVPENEQWLHQPQARGDLLRALDWARSNPPKDSDPNMIFQTLENAGRRAKQQKKRPGTK